MARLAKERTEMFDGVYNVHFTNTHSSKIYVVNVATATRVRHGRNCAVENGWNCIVISCGAWGCVFDFVREEKTYHPLQSISVRTMSMANTF